MISLEVTLPRARDLLRGWCWCVGHLHCGVSPQPGRTRLWFPKDFPAPHLNCNNLEGFELIHVPAKTGFELIHIPVKAGSMAGSQGRVWQCCFAETVADHRLLVAEDPIHPAVG